MANIKVSEMPQANSVNDIDLLMIVQGTANKKVTKQVLMGDVNTTLSNIQEEQETQNTNIENNATAISNLTTRVATNEQNISTKEDKSNKVTSISSSSTDTQYPSAKCVYDIVGNIESILEELDIRRWR